MPTAANIEVLPEIDVRSVDRTARAFLVARHAAIATGVASARIGPRYVGTARALRGGRRIRRGRGRRQQTRHQARESSLGPDECESPGGDDFACVRRIGHRFDSSVSCSCDTFIDMCIAIALPQVELCDPLPSCPALGTETIWAGEWDFEPVVVVQQACDEYPTLDYCISSSPDPRCACACAADVAGTGG